MINEKVATELKGSVRGEVILPEDGRYEDARKVYNAMIDKRPAVVGRYTGVADVIAAVKAARDAGLAIAIRGGGHSVPGFGTADGALVIDLSRMKGIRVDPATKTVRAEGGCTWGDFNHATHAFGLATTGGIISTTGIAGLTLGGGIGYLTRGAGLSLDNLISADVVTADGSFVTANAKENQDLFWALRGGGGNFGVVTSFQYKLQPVKNIVGGPMFFEKEDAEKVMRTFDEYISRAPRELGAFFAWQIAPPLPFIPEDRHGDTLCVLVACWTGPPSEAEEALAPLRGAADLVAAHVGPMPYPALNGAFDDVASDATAFGHREAKYAMVIAGMWPDPAQNEASTQWVKNYYKGLAPHAEEGGYINFAAGDDMNRVRANFGVNYDRLCDVKAKYDSENVFRHNQNISPA